MQTANLPNQVEGNNMKYVIQGLGGHLVAWEDRKAVARHFAHGLLVIDS